MIEIQIDGNKVEVQEGSMVIDAANKLGTYIPHFCYHKKLSIAASCRMCLVEVEKAPKPLPACATPATNGMVVHTHSDKAVKAQKGVMEFLLINHPLDCPICDQGGECQLQDLAVGYGGSNSRYAEEKRVVTPKDVGPLISAREMARCIHCTRCVRFGQEVAGVMEFGMLGRGEHAEITSFVGKTVDSELSGNMIDLCPVGALTSKPFRYSARTWELSRRKSVAPHDGLGSNLIVQVKGGDVLRVLPMENESVNECWISDRDRFSYDGLRQERLAKPMLKQDGKWIEVDWQTALEYVAHGLRNIRHEHGAQAIAGVSAPNATLEEMSLLAKLVRGLGSDSVDFRLRQSDFSQSSAVTPWLGMSIDEFSQLKRAFVIGSSLRKDHPLLAARLRQSGKRGGSVSLLHAVDEDLLMAVAAKMIVAPSAWLSALSEVVVAVAAAKGIAAPVGFESVQAGEQAKLIATNLMSGEPRAVLLGNAAANHPQAAQLHAAAQWIAEATGAHFGYLTADANSVGGHLVGAVPRDAREHIFAQPKKAYLVLHAEPELDSHNPQVARAALEQAEMVVMLSPYQQGFEYADVLLPVAPWSETSGTYVNCEGRAQSFNGSVKPHGDTRPAWKVLRVLGNLLDLQGFDYETPEAVRAEVLGSMPAVADVHARLNLKSQLAPQAGQAADAQALERVGLVPMYATDAIVRRSRPLQETNDAIRSQRAGISTALAAQLGVANGAHLRFTQGQGSAVLEVEVDQGLAANAVRVSAALPSTSTLAGMFGPISVEKV
jgi:NADH-quinone oxidoreductase subunit G